MTPEEASAAIDLVQQLWDGWRPTDAQAAVFRDQFQRLDRDATLQAIRAAYAGAVGRFTKPQLGPIIELARTGLGAASRDETETGLLHDGHSGLWVLCVQTQAQGAKTGWPHLYASFATEVFVRTMPLPNDRWLLKRFQSLAARRQETYGGVWDVRGSESFPISVEEIRRVRRQMLADLPDDEYPFVWRKLWSNMRPEWKLIERRWDGRAGKFLDFGPRRRPQDADKRASDMARKFAAAGDNQGGR